MKCLHIVGARPQFMKLAPLAKNFNLNQIDYEILHTGQHYDKNMSQNFFKELGIKPPKYLFDNHSKPYTEMLSNMITNISSAIDDYTDIIIYGDTLTTLAGAISSAFSGKRIHHIEAGVRSINLDMPEEKIRRIVDEASDYLYCLTEYDQNNLAHVGGNVNVVGDLMYENFLSYKIEDINKDDYIFVTIHREENTREEQLTSIINQLNQISINEKIIFPIHPRTLKFIDRYGLKLKFKPHDVMSYGEVLSHLKSCKYVISDSGGIPKEAYWLGKKSLVVLEGLVYPILETNGYCIRSDFSEIIKNLELLKNLPKINNFNLFGDGKTSTKIINILKNIV